jgi:dGTPase
MGSGARGEMRKVAEVIANLFRYYMEHPEDLPKPPQVRSRAALARQVCDHLAGMTDRYARNQFTRYFLPTGWRAPSP